MIKIFSSSGIKSIVIKLLLFTTAILFLLPEVYPQQYNFVNYTKDKELPGNQIWNIFQDSKGYIWFAATAGLVKYNGKDYKIYNKSNGLIEFFAHNVQEDSKGNIWAGCPRGVSKINGEKITNTILGEFDDFYRIFVDSYDRVWVFNFQLPGDIYLIENDSVFNYSKIYNFQKHRILHVDEDKNGTVYLLTSDYKLYKFFSNNFIEVEYNGCLSEVLPRMFFYDSNDDLILCGNKGVMKVKLKKSSSVYKKEWLLKKLTVYGIEDKHGNYWIATLNNGLYRIRDKNILHITENNGLPTSKLYTLFEDREQNLWIGTNLRGVVKLSSVKIVNFGRKEGFQDEAVFSILLDKDGIFCIGDNKLYRFKEPQFIQLKTAMTGSKSKIKWPVLMDIIKLPDNKYLLGGATGLYLMDNNNNLKILGLNNLIVFNLLHDSNNNIWIGTNNGVYKLDNNKTPVFQDFGIKNMYVNKLMEVNNKDLYAATNDGLVIIKNALVRYGEKSVRMLTTKDGLLSNTVFDLSENPEGDVFIGTEAGINILSDNNILNITEGLPNRVIVDLFIDSKGRLWAGTNDGISLIQKIDGKYKVVDNYSSKDGLISSEFPKNQTILEDSSGRIWFGTYEGLNVYNPSEDYQTNVKPLCKITSVLVNDSISIPVDNMIHEFNYKQNKFLFSFDGLSFIDEDKVQFEYYLEPLEKPWSSITHQREINYSFLKPGNYSFHVRVKNPSGFISNPQSVSFTIETPFWEEGWFYILCIILLIVLGYLVNYYRLQRIKRNNLQLEKLVNQKTKELKNSRDEIAKQYKSLMEAQKQLVEKEKLEKSYKEIEILKNRLSIENIYLKEKQTKVFEVESIIGKSKEIQQIRKQIIEVAGTDATVLVTGKTGVGKNLVVEAIHALSLRKDRTLISVNCAAIPEGLIESELFGHEKGAFTGANERRIGKFEIADGSTIFLDEIGDMDLNLQSKILTVLQEKKLTRIGGNKSININVRVIAATNYFLEDLVKKGKFRSDLYYRLNVFQIHIPPLYERIEDVEILTKFFVDKYSRIMNKKITGITKSALKKLNNYNFPGNIRELENIIQRSIIICKSKVITDEDIVIQTNRDNDLYEIFSDNYLMPLDQLERRYVLQVLKITGWKIHGKGGAAEILKLHPNTLRSRMTKLDIPFSDTTGND